MPPESTPSAQQTLYKLVLREFFLEPDLYVWTVDAFDDQGQIAGSERGRAYLYLPPEGPPAGEPPLSDPGWTRENGP